MSTPTNETKAESKSREPETEPKAESKSREPETDPKAESKSREPENEPKAKSKSREPGNETKAESYIASSFQYFSSYNFRLVVEFILIPHSEGEFYSSKSEGARASIRQLIVTLTFERCIKAFPIFQFIDVSVPDNTFADFQLVVELIPTLNSEGAQAPSSKLIVGCGYSKKSFHFCEDCRILFCEGVKDDQAITMSNHANSKLQLIVECLLAFGRKSAFGR